MQRRMAVDRLEDGSDALGLVVSADHAGDATLERAREIGFVRDGETGSLDGPSRSGERFGHLRPHDLKGAIGAGCGVVSHIRLPPTTRRDWIAAAATALRPWSGSSRRLTILCLMPG